MANTEFWFMGVSKLEKIKWAIQKTKASGFNLCRLLSTFALHHWLCFRFLSIPFGPVIFHRQIPIHPEKAQKVSSN
jgi:hypothetical protein